MDAAPFSAHTVNTLRSAVEGVHVLPDGSWLYWALSRRQFGPMSFRSFPEVDVAYNRKEFLKLHDLNINDCVGAGLKHTNNVAIVGREDITRGARELATAPQETDALLTKDKDVVLLTTHADCLPVWLVTPDSGWIGMAHVGWKGLLNGIIKNLIDTIPEEDRNNVHLAVGPGICARHYEVGPEVAELFENHEILSDIVIKDNGRLYLDLPRGAQLYGEASGATVDMSANVCTYENQYLSSFRRDKSNFMPMAAIITKYDAI